MILQKRIPKDFYKLFRTQNMEYYMLLLVALYKENALAYMALGLTEEECRGIISHTMVKSHMAWIMEIEDVEEEIQEFGEAEAQNLMGISPASVLSHLTKWGWLKKDYDEKLNRDIYAFPEYSQLYIELFQHLQTEDDSRERESILSIYSALYTYYSDQDRNNIILNNALQTCRRLSQLMTNMQDGMRSYFELLARENDFKGIQKVLIDEMSQSDSKKYAILTTTDSFYRYKEEIKELLSKIFIENDLEKSKISSQFVALEENTLAHKRLEMKLEWCEEATQITYRLEREFDLMEKKYNRLIEQKTIFAKRALARSRYILQEGNNKEDCILQWIHLLTHSENQEEILEQTREQMGLTSQFKVMTDESFSSRKNQIDTEFKPASVTEIKKSQEEPMTDYIPKPLYTKKQLREFIEINRIGDTFVATENTVQSLEDLEKLLFVWQEATESNQTAKEVLLGEDIKNNQGLSFSQLKIKGE
ncbi:MAG: DUF5716 family protein [Eubacteriales bacterium]